MSTIKARTNTRNSRYRRATNSNSARRNQRIRNRATRQELLQRTLLTANSKGCDAVVTAHGSSGFIATTTTNDDINVVNLIQPGNGSFNRVGKKIVMTSLRVKGVLKYLVLQNGVTPSLSNFLRVVLVYDRQPNGVLPVFSTIFGHTDQTGTETTSLEDPLRYDAANRFKILREWNYDTTIHSSTANNLAVQEYITVDEYVRLPDLETLYQGQSSPCTISDIASGALYLIFRAGNDITTSYVVPSNMMYRLRYFD